MGGLRYPVTEVCKMRLNPYFMESIYAYANAKTLVIFYITDPAHMHSTWVAVFSALLNGYAYELTPVIILPILIPHPRDS